ncbi:uncharacterized protein LOC110675176 [Aedes aegypti]|uniref:Uncharacterized protein n=1 Tax=Aedes aegypti TaxID=7159 RepID=A0A6I8U9P3_AEDAE|nr:uncharacterized protein LOC110675176 [Aedes aegypti]
MNEEYYRLRHGTVDQATVASVSVGQRSNRQDFTRRSSNHGRFGNQQKSRWDQLGSKRPATTVWNSSGGERCFRCNSMFHRPSDCMAIDKTCLKCGRKGHFKRACKTLIRPGSKRLSDAENSEIDAKRIAVVDMDENAKQEERPTDAEVGDKKF